jgi:hypothetical protein
VRQYVVIELVISTKGNERRRIDEFPEEYERAARRSFDWHCEHYPETYFELLLIEHTEKCLDYTGRASSASDQPKDGQG